MLFYSKPKTLSLSHRPWNAIMHTHDHCHGHGKNAPHRVLLFAIILTFAFALIEGATGWYADSLALLGDAGHMASDALALGIAAFAAWLTTKPPSSKHSYGLGRAEVVAAWISSLLMLLISVAIIVEAVNRLHTPVTAIKSLPMLIVASLGICINLAIAWMLARSERSLNIRAALLHVMGDLLGSFAALIAGAVIHYTGFAPIDPILSIFISILIMLSSIRLLRESLLVLMEGVPKNIKLDDVLQTLSAIEHVDAIHDLHIWTLSSGTVMLSAHVSIRQFSSWPTVLDALRNTLKSHFGIDHVTLQPESETIDCQPCNGNPRTHEKGDQQ